ncbi:unnamed protein product [Rangifer tarandus platyrhynchus]|uniref:Uncharacterized protein n=2 Tax=Rangifer tarandus platyrhynchus TaxID=3082113 RepID=A0ABN8Y9W1_RANTA|nr:unnamed protein product [Rangifer tarandus platyrhynchus]CAI9695351.1 unnamed protein product [Rangifer tarandus platyrhynchus]
MAGPAAGQAFVLEDQAGPHYTLACSPGNNLTSLPRSNFSARVKLVEKAAAALPSPACFLEEGWEKKRLFAPDTTLSVLFDPPDNVEGAKPLALPLMVLNSGPRVWVQLQH